jgi:DNA-binding beta-propeller fold protein YncE
MSKPCFPGSLLRFARIFILAALFSPPLAAQQSAVDMDALYAGEAFRIGDQAYNRYGFNEAILSCERALSFKPGEPLIMDWLGRAYYRSGLEETSLRQWRAAAAAYGWNSGEGMLLGTRIETVENRRGFLPVSDDEERYVEAGRYPGTYEEIVYYRQPTSVLPVDDGSVWVVAYGSNEIVRVDVNGIIRERHRGPLNGFDRPYDLVKGSGGRLYLSEYRGGRISVLSGDGEWQSYIGSKGLGDGNLLGPQNLEVDQEGYLYVVDYGNRRVCKFDPEGNFILSFGKTPAARFGAPDFTGFLSPTGIAARDGRVFVADAAIKRIFIFDSNGTYQGILAAEGLKGPESLRFLQDGRLLAADTNRILLIDPNSAMVRELGVLGSPRVRIVGAGMDRNGNVLAANFDAGEVSVLTRLDDMASGLFVQIGRVSAENFPLVTIDIQVEDRQRRPVVGLDSRNFLLSENGRAAAEQEFLTPGYRSLAADVSILVERSPAAQLLRDDFAAAVRDINEALTSAPQSPPATLAGIFGEGAEGAGRIVSLISAGAQPRRERIDTSLSAAARGNAADYDPRWRFDTGLRLAATDLLPGEKKRAVIFLTSGSLSELAFEQYSLSELASYMANNGIVFYAVTVNAAPPAEEIRYLCRETGGEILPLYRPEGIREAIQKLKAYPSGAYTLSYRSQLPTDFGRAYLPVEAEVYLMERSGRDGTGYFPPLE